MVKASSSDILTILRRFEVATDDTVPRQIEQVSYTHPTPKNTLAAFRFNKHQFYILFDETAEDDTSYVLEQVQTVKQDVIGDVVENPRDNLTTYAMPFKGKEVYLYALKSDKKRLDVELAERYPETSRSTWQKYVKEGYVQVNGTVQTVPKFELTEHDAIAVAIPPSADYSAESLPILYIDDNVIVINKPAGVLSHAKGALNDEFTVADFFRRYTSYKLDTNRPGIIHRLDRDTSGVMIGARNEKTAALLQKQFAERRTKKTYIAIVVGEPKLAEAKIDLPIGRNPAKPSTFRVDAKGKPAITSYTVLAARSGTSLVKLSPRTGRTHQLRVHMEYIHTPILGDRVYGKAADRLYLHAFSLEVTIPEGERRTFIAPVPADFVSFYPESETFA